MRKQAVSTDWMVGVAWHGTIREVISKARLHHSVWLFLQSAARDPALVSRKMWKMEGKLMVWRCKDDE